MKHGLPASVAYGLFNTSIIYIRGWQTARLEATIVVFHCLEIEVRWLDYVPQWLCVLSRRL